ncbi:BTAD domain-containing putative transcriptional regulator [Hamadaea tsunoensis]|uniref:BTAD domain-containing putative transcriptional regulator n=1 Tax=Hamadaea tsunoensis TaxID=53368 RepID=UPI0004018A69|nr:BTAD domain-containing putative transcriptional regulator [Hamadaea tsunoensis]
MDHRPQPSRVGVLLREYRRRAQLTQQQLAERSGLSIRAVRDLESGKVAAPRAGSLARLNEVLGLSGVDGLDQRVPGVRIGVLGPLTVVASGLPADPGPPAQRTVLGLLALRAGETVSRDEIVDVVWGDDPPRTAVGQVQTAVSRLRRLLEEDGTVRLHTAPHGYRLALGPDEVDSAEFAALLDAGRTEAALRCWRGLVLADAPARLRTHPAALALARQRITAALAYAASGGPAVDLLRELAAQEPLHEPLHARLVLVLARAGDRAAALQAHAEITDRLADELGVLPGDELRSAYREAAGDDEPARVHPAQLPGVGAGFVGRLDALRRLDTSRAAVSVVTGTAGVGKTTLAVRWAQSVRQSYPDGQLFADLHGFDPAGAIAHPGTVLRGFLAALGVPAGRVPAGFDAQAGLYRSLMAERRMLVVLDNARDAAQVRPLLPGAPGCRVVVTSRDQLRPLLAEGAEPITLDLLSPSDAVRLLAERIGPQRTYAEPRVAEHIAERCARLPLALGVAAARAALYPGFSLAEIADGLRPDDADLGELGDVRAVFSWSYQALGEDAATLFALCALVPGTDFAAPAAASLAGWPASRTRAALGELVRAHLVTEHAPGRFTQHDLLRAYANELLDADGQRDARLRVLDHYRATATAAALLLDPHREPIVPQPLVTGVTVLVLADADQAMAWFTAEHAVLMAAAERAAATGEDARAWQLAWSLLDYLDNRGHWRDWITVEGLALTAAARRGDRIGEAYAHRLLGRGHAQLGEYAQAIGHYSAAFTLYHRHGDLLGSAHTSMGRSFMHMTRGSHHAAQRDRFTALDLYRRAGHAIGESRALNAIGWGYAQLGEYARALEHCRQALVLAEPLDDPAGCAAIWDSIGYVHHHLGEHELAVECLDRAVTMFRRVHDLYNEADALTHLGDAYADTGRTDDARASWEAAVTILDRLSHPDVDGVRARLKD